MSQSCDLSAHSGSLSFSSSDWPIFILSLKDDIERRAPLMSSLEEMGFSPEVLFGVDGRHGLTEWAERQVNRERQDWLRRPLTDAELACSLSHRRAYQEIVDKNLPGAIIFEDDAKLDPKFKCFWDAKGYKHGDMVLLAHRKCWVKPRSRQGISPGVFGYKICVEPDAAYGYCISHKAAETLLSAATPVREVADWPCNISEMNVLALDPQLALHDGYEIASSHLEEARNAVRKSNLRPKPRWQRILFRRLRRSYWQDWVKKKLSRRLS